MKKHYAYQNKIPKTQDNTQKIPYLSGFYFVFIDKYHQTTESMISIMHIPCKATSTRLFQIFKKSNPVKLNSKNTDLSK